MEETYEWCHKNVFHLKTLEEQKPNIYDKIQSKEKEETSFMRKIF